MPSGHFAMKWWSGRTGIEVTVEVYCMLRGLPLGRGLGRPGRLLLRASFPSILTTPRRAPCVVDATRDVLVTGLGEEDGAGSEPRILGKCGNSRDPSTERLVVFILSTVSPMMTASRAGRRDSSSRAAHVSGDRDSLGVYNLLEHVLEQHRVVSFFSIHRIEYERHRSSPPWYGPRSLCPEPAAAAGWPYATSVTVHTHVSISIRCSGDVAERQSEHPLLAASHAPLYALPRSPTIGTAASPAVRLALPPRDTACTIPICPVVGPPFPSLPSRARRHLLPACPLCPLA